MIPYFVMLAIAYGLSLKVNETRMFDDKQAQMQKWILIAVMTVFIAFRYGVGADFFAYIKDYEIFSELTWGECIVHKDPMTSVLAKVTSIFCSNYKLFFVGMALIFIGCSICTVYRYSTDYTLSIVLFIICGSFLDCCNAARQCIAVGIVFADYVNIKNQKLINHILFIVLATLFHASAITMMPLYFIFSPRASKMQTMMWLAGTAALMLFSFGSLFEATGEILGKDLDPDVAYFTHTVNTFRVLVYVAPCVLLFFTKEMKKRIPSYAVFILFNAILTLVTCRSAYLMRICIYTNVFLCLALPEALQDLKLPKETIRSVKYIMVTCYMLFWVFNTYTSAGLYPYRFSLFD